MVLFGFIWFCMFWYTVHIRVLVLYGFRGYPMSVDDWVDDWVDVHLLIIMGNH